MVRWTTIRAFLLVVCSVATLQAAPAAAVGCEDFVPAGCTRVKPGTRIEAVVKNKCYVFDQESTGSNVYEHLNVLDGGRIYFVDPGMDGPDARTIHFKVSALLIEKGGVVQAGSPACPFGKEGGNRARFGHDMAVDVERGDGTERVDAKIALHMRARRKGQHDQLDCIGNAQFHHCPGTAQAARARRGVKPHHWYPRAAMWLSSHHQLNPAAPSMTSVSTQPSVLNSCVSGLR